MRLSITSTFEIAAAHHLPHHQGKCHRLHGHNYRLEFTRYGTVKPAVAELGYTYTTAGAGSSASAVLTTTTSIPSDAGMIMDFGDFDGAIKAVLERLDHYTLNDLSGLENPTAEHLALWLLEQLPQVHRVVVWETGRHNATAEREVVR